MDLEAMQLLNLSPIPELSELELSTMLDHLSGLSDVNGDLTDRNVEDILKEAEDLLDKSISSKTNDSKAVNSSHKSENKMENENVAVCKDNNKEQNVQELDLNESKHYNTPSHSDHTSRENISNEDDTEKNINSLENTPTKSHSPGSSCNHIRSTIDSLKEFSSLIEKKLSSHTPNSSPSHNKELKQTISTQQEKKITITDSEVKKDLKPICITTKNEKPNLTTKKTVPDPVGKSIKLLNCFERLYQDRPVRLAADKKSKVIDKSPRKVANKKLTKTLKNNKNNVSQQIKHGIDAKIYTNYSSPQTDPDEEKSCRQNRKSLKPSFLNNGNSGSQLKISGNGDSKNEQKNCFGDHSLTRNPFKYISTKVDEKLNLKFLGGGGGEKIKVQTGRNDIVGNGLNPENIRISLSDIDKPLSSVDSEEEKLNLISEKKFGIKRLEKQFCSLKEKYEEQMAKLEAENLKLRDALNAQQKSLSQRMAANFTVGNTADSEHSPETKNSKTLSSSSPSSCSTDNKILQSVSLENCKAPKNSPCSSLENCNPSPSMKEAFCQTEKEVKNTSIQCSKECKDTGTNAEIISETKRVENKENVSVKKKLGRSKPFSDINIHQMMKQKKILDHETQLLATLRGLQAEVNLKDKENRKLKSEIDSLRKQVKKPINSKTETCRKCHIGTQTIGLGSYLQKPYNPQNFEVPQEFGKENEELRSRIRVLEEDIEILKEKRINDLQSLHQVHEEEMAKVVSKLETQSALTRHLHSLLINR